MTDSSFRDSCASAGKIQPVFTDHREKLYYLSLPFEIMARAHIQVYICLLAVVTGLALGQVFQNALQVPFSAWSFETLLAHITADPFLTGLGIVLCHLVFFLIFGFSSRILLGIICLIACIPLIYIAVMIIRIIPQTNENNYFVPLRIIPGFIIQTYIIFILIRLFLQSIGVPNSVSCLYRRFHISQFSVQALMRDIFGFPPTMRYMQKNWVPIALLALVASALTAAIAWPVYNLMTNYWEDLKVVMAACRDTTNSAKCFRDGVWNSIFWSYFMAPVVIFFFFVGATVTRRMLHSRSIVPLLMAQASDTRRPILFLRSFRDDQVRLANTATMPLLTRLVEAGVTPDRLDWLLNEEASPFGPVVAIGDPSDATPPYGIARAYFADNKWQDAVSQLANDSQTIVICLDDTEGVWWELEFLFREGLLEKTLILLHPNAQNVTLHNNILDRLFDMCSDLGTNQNSGDPINANDSHLSTIQAIIESVRSDKQSKLLAITIGGLEKRHYAITKNFSKGAYLCAIRGFLRSQDGRGKKLETALQSK